MTIKFHSNLSTLVIGRGVMGAGFDLPTAITVYSGSQPPALDIVSNWANYNSTKTNLLAHYRSVIWSQALDGGAANCSITTFPPSTLPINAGTAEWCIIWTTNPLVTDLNTGTIPTPDFLVCSVSTLSDHGVIRFANDTVFTIGNSKDIADGIIAASSN